MDAFLRDFPLSKFLIVYSLGLTSTGDWDYGFIRCLSFQIKTIGKDSEAFCEAM